jgi:hypothetical protein
MFSANGLPTVSLGTGTGLGYLNKYGLGGMAYKGKELDCFVANGSGFSIGNAASWTTMGQSFKMDNASTTAQLCYSVPVHDPIFELDRVGTWYICAMMQSGGYGPTTKYAVVRYRDNEGTDQLLELSADFKNSGATHIEVIVYWDAGIFEVYKLGTLIQQLDFTEFYGPIDVGFCSRVATSVGGWSLLNHMYFVIDNPNSGEPTGRLGACTVESEPLAVYNTAGNFDPIDPSAGLAILNNYDPTKALTGTSVLSDPSSRPLTVGVDPTSVKETVAAQITVITYRDPSSQANTVVQLDVPDSEPTIVNTAADNVTAHTLVVNNDAAGNPLQDAGKIPTVTLWSKL